MIPESFLQEIRARVPIVTVIAQRVRLMRRGRTFVGLCPFHNEKTPSFTVHPVPGSYHCFGCGAKGDVISFVRAQEGLPFIQAIQQLADQAGLVMPKTPIRNSLQHAGHVHTKMLYQALEHACAWFTQQLHTTPAARAYCQQRGLDEHTCALYRLGFAPTAGFMAMADKIKLPRHTWVQAGLAMPAQNTMPAINPSHTAHNAHNSHPVRTSDTPSTLYSRFRQRLIFPILDERQRVIGFGARALTPQQQPKYLNSPETELFLKGKILYRSCPAALTQPAQGLPTVVVEGYMDVIAVGPYYPAVAPLGTALTPDQLQLLWRQCPEPVLCFDGDRAGQQAMLKAAIMALGHLKPGYSLRIACLPLGHDPESFLTSSDQSYKAFATLIHQAIPLSAYLHNTLFASHSPSMQTPERQAAAQQQWQEWMQAIADPTVRQAYRAMAYGHNLNNKRFGRQKNHRTSALSTPMSTSIPTAPPTLATLHRTNLHERLMLVWVMRYPGLWDQAHEILAQVDFPVASPWHQVHIHLAELLNSHDPHTLKVEDTMAVGQSHMPDMWTHEMVAVGRHLPACDPWQANHPVPTLAQTFWQDLVHAYHEQKFARTEIQQLTDQLRAHMHDPEASQALWQRLQALTTA